MSFAKKMARKKINKLRKDADAGARKGSHNRQDVLRSYYQQNVSDTKVWQDTICDMMILFCYALHREYGFSKKRLERFYEKAVLTSICLRGKYVTFPELEQILKDEAKYVYPHEEIDNQKYNHANKIRLKTIEEMSIIFYYSIWDVFGYANTRLKRLSKCMAAEATAMSEGKLTVADLERALKEKTGVNFDKDFSHLNEEETA